MLNALSLAAMVAGPALHPHTDPPPTVQLEWNAPDACPDEVAVFADVQRLRTRAHEDVVAQVRGDVARTRGGDVLELTIDSARGREERRLEAVSCELL